MLNKTRLILLVAILSATAGAIVFKTPSVFFLLATLIAAPILAGAMGKWMSRGLRVSRQMPLVGTVGDELCARITVRNSGQVPALLVHAKGRGADGKPRGADGKPRGAQWRRPKTKSQRDPLLDYATFFEIVGQAELIVPILMPGASFSGEVAWQLKRRGLVPWPGARAGTVDPIALSDPLSAHSAPAELLILPRPLHLRCLSLCGGSPSSQFLQRATIASDAAEVHGVRPYQPGEGGRRIHWGATARTGQLHVIEWEEESASDLTILLDTQAQWIAGLPGDDTLEHAITAVASVAAFLLGSGQRARIFWWADDVAADEPRLMHVESRHQTGLTQILSALAKIVPCRHANATLAALGARAQSQTGDENVLLVGSDRADWNEALAPWKRGRLGGRASGLAFAADSFDEAAREAFTLRAGEIVTATMQRLDASKTPQKSELPMGVHRVKRTDSLVDVLEKKL